MDKPISATKPLLLADYFTEREMGRELHRSVRTLARMRKLKIGPPFVLINTVPYYNKEAATQWLANGGTATASNRSGRSRKSKNK
jgi:hypothetical protein